MAELTAGEVFTPAIRELVRQFGETEAAALAGEPDGVHQHRTVVRRLRSVLQVFRDLLDPFAVMQLRGSLREWGSALGVVRDYEVAAQLADALISDVDSASSDLRVAARLVRPDQQSALSAHRRVVQIHDLPRFRDMRHLLHTFAAHPPLTPAAAGPAENIRDLLITDSQRLVRKTRRMTRSLDSHHELRKRARRLRHAIEAAMTDAPGMFGDRMHAVSTAAHRIQTALGDHRDAVFLATRIDRVRVLAGRAGEDTPVYDDLASRARALADEHARTLRPAQKKLANAVDNLSP